ncbi:glucose-6-phosphate isomerase [Olsenella sp. SW781]|uniref:glucose-6-phosphate isomerase family protein n=1 Tax=Olsenella sp. SW781 TaxID=2530046 RepID=UPI00143B9BFE|nr:glucose-6-phosphate isomerase family protein [Olsenella sp. SW781]NJE80972.1 glucose-6-phosphate isomerase [Olsenella sp. SW781]
MIEITDPTVRLTLDHELVGEEVQVGAKLFSDAKGWYLHPGCLPDETVMYRVYSYTEGNNTRSGNLNSGVTILSPVTVAGECNMTRGHWHEERACVEFYYGLSGTGLLMLMDESGRTWAEHVFPGSVHHIDGHWAHRLINTGDVDFAVGACWGCNAGHDYRAVEQLPFGARVFKEKDGSISVVAENRQGGEVTQ